MDLLRKLCCKTTSCLLTGLNSLPCFVKGQPRNGVPEPPDRLPYQSMNPELSMHPLYEFRKDKPVMKIIFVLLSNDSDCPPTSYGVKQDDGTRCRLIDTLWWSHFSKIFQTFFNFSHLLLKQKFWSSFGNLSLFCSPVFRVEGQTNTIFNFFEFSTPSLCAPSSGSGSQTTMLKTHTFLFFLLFCDLF